MYVCYTTPQLSRMYMYLLYLINLILGIFFLFSLFFNLSKEKVPKILPSAQATLYMYTDNTALALDPNTFFCMCEEGLEPRPIHVVPQAACATVLHRADDG